nr:MFS transporter [Acidocella sp.]
MSSAKQARNIALIVASALFMEQLDGTVISTALPAMAASFHSAPAFMSLAMTAYLLSLAVCIPASGQIADRYGARLVFRVAILVFTASSLACAVAPDFAALIAARVVQGMGGAMMVPVGRLILLRSVDKADRIVAMAWLLTPGMLGPVVGPPLGGLIVTFASWRWIFLINLPIGILGF